MLKMFLTYQYPDGPSQSNPANTEYSATGMTIDTLNKIQSYLPKFTLLLNETIKNAAIADTRTIMA